MENKNKKFEAQNRMILTFIICAIVLLIIFYINSTLKQNKENAYYTVEEVSKVIVAQVDALMNEASGSIEMVSTNLSNQMTSKELENPQEKIALLLEDTPFMFIEYINQKGINYLENGEKFNASDRIYYKEGIQGKRGVWINYHPKLSKEPLINFYTPIYFENEIVGVITGTLGGNSDFNSLLQMDYMGEQIISVLVDENNQVISANFPVEGDMLAEDIFQKFNVTKEDQEVFLEHIKNKDHSVFEYEGEKGNGVACIDYIKNKNWSTVVIVPSYSLSAVIGKLVYTSIFTLASILILFTIYVVYIIMSIRKEASVGEERQYQMIRGFSEFYHSVYYVNLLTDQAECIRIQDPKAIEFGIVENGTVPYLETFVNYVIGQADKEEQEKLAFFMDRYELRHLLWNQSNYVRIYKNKNGGYSQISIVRADEKNKEKSEVRYMLLGIRDVTNQLKEQM